MKRWFALSMSTLLLACAAPQVHETVHRPRASATSSSGGSAAKRARASARKAGLESDVVQSKRTRSDGDGKDVASGTAIRGSRLTPGRSSSKDPLASLGAGASAEDPSEAEEQEKAIDAAGIEGTMSEYDVKATMDERSADFDRCHDATGRSGSGRIKFRIRILPSGDVSDVNVRKSSVRNQELVGCYTDVIMASRFPSPHGGYADVTWSTKVGRSKKKPDEWFERKVRWDAPSQSAANDSGSSGSSRRHRRHGSRRHRGS